MVSKHLNSDLIDSARFVFFGIENVTTVMLPKRSWSFSSLQFKVRSSVYLKYYILPYITLPGEVMNDLASRGKL